MSINAMMHGARLAYVVRELPGNVKREVCKYNKARRTIERRLVEKPAGFMIYFPRGHAIRLETVEELRHYNLDKDPQIVNLDGLHDPNSPAGKLVLAKDDETRHFAMLSLEEQVIALATARSGKTLMPEQLERKAVAA
jgi:hypothetical protein